MSSCQDQEHRWQIEMDTRHKEVDFLRMTCLDCGKKRTEPKKKNNSLTDAVQDKSD